MKIVYNGEKCERTFSAVLSEVVPALAEKDEKVVYLDADLSNCVGMLKFTSSNERGINCGIAEADMIGIASGLASVGFKPYCHTFGPFASRRVYDQAFLSAGYGGNPITIMGSDPGVTAAFNGGTHMPFEDMAMYRAMPEATVLEVTDSNMFEDILRKVKDMPGVKYIRFPRKDCVKVYEAGSEFEIGKGIVVKEGKDAVIIASGIMVVKALEAAEKLQGEGIDAAVIDMFTVKPIDAELVVKYAKATGAVITAENHNRIGGLTSAVSEVLAMNCPTPLEYVAVEDIFGEVGPQNFLEERFGLTVENIVGKVKAAISRK